MARIFLDTEFIERGPAYPLQLISIGLVMDDGENPLRTYYAESNEYDPNDCNDWVKENVLPHLDGGEVVKDNATIAQEILHFVGDSPEFWAYFADYDWVVLCQLYGSMIDLKTENGWPMFCLDLKQLMWHLDIRGEQVKKDVLQPENAHNALADAYWNYRVFNYLNPVAHDDLGIVGQG